MWTHNVTHRGGGHVSDFRGDQYTTYMAYPLPKLSPGHHAGIDDTGPIVTITVVGRGLVGPVVLSWHYGESFEAVLAQVMLLAA